MTSLDPSGIRPTRSDRPGGALIAAPNRSGHTQAPRGASAECSALHDSKTVSPNGFRPEEAMLHRARTALAPPPVSLARAGQLRFGCPNNDENL